MKVVKAPNPIENPGNWPTVFLAGSIEMGKAEKWQDRVARELQDFNILFMNPRRDTWDSSWEQRISNPQFKEQVTWELDCLDMSSLIAMHFDPSTQSPITLHELGLYATSKKLLVSCPDGFWRKGNVEVTCHRFNIPLFPDLDSLVEELKNRFKDESEVKDNDASNVHSKCRGEIYHYRTDDASLGTVPRFPVPDDKVCWSVPWADYKPTQFTAPFVLTAAWADPQLGTEGFRPAWNSMDGKVNRESHEGEYLVEKGRPLNIRGRTGVEGRGVLGKWGPNHAADPIVTRWRRDGEGNKVMDEISGKAILEFVSIQRKDSGEWALPGGMVDPGEQVSVTVRREFMEEALDTTGTAKDDVAKLGEMVEEVFKNGEVVYEGYVDDPRNTDNAWMETVAFNFHDEAGDSVGKFPLHAGDDAGAIRWAGLDGNAQLYASHARLLKIVAEKRRSHW